MIVALIGVFLLLYGLWYPLKGDLWTYLGVTGTIYLASMSVLLIAAATGIAPTVGARPRRSLSARLSR